MKSFLVLLGLFFTVHANTITKRQNAPTYIPRGGSLPQDKRNVLTLEFNDTAGNTVSDSSGYKNNGYLMAGAILVNFKNGKCGNAAYTYCGDILFHGDTFQGKPYEGVTICAWINLKSVEGSHSIFDTIGMTHSCGQYHFEVINGMVRWFHRNESQVTIFSNTAEGLMVKPDTWTHVCGTYDSASGKSKIYINGMLRNMTIGSGYLSRDWVARAGIGDHKAARPLMGFIDEFKIYNYALERKDIVALVNKCAFLPKPISDEPSIASPKPFLFDLTQPQTPDNGVPIDAAARADDYLPLKKPAPKPHANMESIEEAVLKRSKVHH